MGKQKLSYIRTNRKDSLPYFIQTLSTFLSIPHFQPSLDLRGVMLSSDRLLDCPVRNHQLLKSTLRFEFIGKELRYLCLKFWHISDMPRCLSAGHYIVRKKTQSEHRSKLVRDCASSSAKLEHLMSLFQVRHYDPC